MELHRLVMSLRSAFLTSHSEHQGHLSAFRLVLQVAGGPDLGLDILQVGQGLVENLQLPLGGRG